MGILDFLQGKRQPPDPGGMTVLQEAADTLSQAGLRFENMAGLCYRTTGDCGGKIKSIGSYPRSSGISAGCRTTEDSYGCAWILLEGDLPLALASARAAYEAVAKAGCGQDFLCAVFAYSKAAKKIYWIFNYAGRFYPFAPEGEERDSMVELNLKRAVDHALPVEPTLSHWYPLWNMPL